ncbi:hypothetical protein G3T37_11010 [Galbitalea soli]|uniref:Uncharacterized protein n=2 Tax=Galbitalea soli TaxID=1268042 RepID=A0A7C9PNU6_9MICO|nr:hypothetical protein [Galbitalea soli]
MTVLAIVAAVGLVVDPRVVTGAPLWAKPLKFALSILIYAVSLAWLIGQLQRGRRLGWWAGTIASLFLAVEIVVIVGAAAFATTSHFNVTTPFHTMIWGLMAFSIVVVWAAAIPVAVLLWRAPLGDPARTLAIRAGLLIALLGMALAFLMTSPTPAQLADFHGVSGAHTVGRPDGGPGLPLLGWSTVAGDLRIPHFVGMHALQLIPLAALALELLGRRVAVLARARVRVAVIRAVVGLYLGGVVVLTWQALRGQSIVHPDALTVGVTAALVLLAVAAAVSGSAAATRRRAPGSIRPS